MKKRISVTAVLLALLLLAGCSGTSVGSYASKYANSEDYDAAVQEVQLYLNGFSGLEMPKIRYAGDDAVKAEADSRGLAPEQVMILTSTITADDSYDGTDFEPGNTYEDYRWILTRNSSVELWEIADQG